VVLETLLLEEQLEPGPEKAFRQFAGSREMEGMKGACVPVLRSTVLGNGYSGTHLSFQMHITSFNPTQIRWLVIPMAGERHFKTTSLFPHQSDSKLLWLLLIDSELSYILFFSIDYRRQFSPL